MRDMRNQRMPALMLLAFLAGCCLPPQDNLPLPQDSSISRIERNRTRDLRTLFRAPAAIQSLENAHACLVESGWRGSHAFEKHVGNGLPLDRLIKQLYGESYDGQVKLISQDSIVQTSLVEYNPGKQAEMFVHPGDLVFILGRD